MQMKLMVLVCGSALVLVSAGSSAFDLKMPSMPSMLAVGGAPAANAPAGVDAAVMQEGIVQRYVQASTQINTAQLELARAFDLKDQVALLEAEQTALNSGAVIEKDAVANHTKISETAGDAIQQKIDEKAQLSDEGKIHFANGLLPFAMGLATTSRMPGDLKAFADAAKLQVTNAPIMQKLAVTSKLSTGVYLAGALPGFTSRVFDGFKKILTFAKDNAIPVPQDATDALASL